MNRFVEEIAAWVNATQISKKRFERTGLPGNSPKECILHCIRTYFTF